MAGSPPDIARNFGSGRLPYQSPGARKEKLRERSYSARRGGSPLPYAELRAASAFSFLDGASLPEDLVARAAELALPAVALVDRNGVYGAPRFWKAAKSAGLEPLVGAEVTLQETDFLFEAKEETKNQGKSFRLRERRRKDDEKDERAAVEGGRPGEASATRDPGFGPSPSMKAFRFSPLPRNRSASFFFDLPRVTLLAESRTGYRNLCKLLTAAAAGRPKGEARASWEQVAAHAEGLHLLTGGDESPLARALDAGDADDARALLERWAHAFPGRVHVELQRHGRREEERRNRALVELARRLRLPLVATNGVRFAQADDKPLFDVLTAIRCHTPLDAAGALLAPNRERHLRGAAEMARRFRDLPEAVTHAWELSQRLDFTLDDLGYRFPDFPLPPGETPSSWLRALTWNAARSRFRPLSAKAQAQIQRELDLIAKLDLAGYFLIVADLVEYCRRERVLCQGRGSAANSAVCYALGITAVDPVRMELLFERFLSEERGEWPDIDLDLPSGDQREKVIQYVYEKYGAAGGGPGAAMTANVITYRDRSAAREVGKALGFSAEQIDQLAKQLGSFRYDLERGDEKSFQKEMRAAGFDPDERRLRLFGEMWRRIQNLPRHLGQHSGGMVIAAGRLDEVVPLEPAAMPGRVVVQWDKDDCADLGLIKIDLLGLGMLNALEQVIPIVREREGVALDLAHLPADDPEVYAMLRAADTVGVFQVESRAQMASLPRNAPTRFYDLVIQVAIIRPGPITGGMVHPFFERRMGREEVTYFHPCLEPILKRTLGVPIFQEQLLRMAMAVSGFSGGEAEELRRAMGFKRSVERMSTIEERLRAGMTAKGIVGENQDRIVQSITSFALYGFPESHAASFALIAYASSYLKCHHPTAFLIGLLNAWPMGFYHPATLVKDAERHGVTVLPIDVNFSRVECTWEERRDESVSRQDKDRDESRDEKLPLKGTATTRPTSSSSDVPPTFPSRRPAQGLMKTVPKAEDGPSTDPLDGAQDHPRPRVGGQRAQRSRAPASPQRHPSDAAQPTRTKASGACRLGLRYVDAFKQATAERVVAERDRGGPFRDVDDLVRRTHLRGEELEKLSSIGALASLGLTRRQALWQAALAVKPKGELFEDGSSRSSRSSPLPEMSAYEQTTADFEGTGMSTGVHPMAYWRSRLDGQGVLPTAELPRRPPGERARIAGAVIVRQRPGTAKGTLFLTLEDETGMAQAIVSAPMLQANRATILGNSGLVIEGKVVAKDGSVSLRAEKLWPLPELDLPDGISHDFY